MPLGTSKQLSTIIEGESLLNDGMAIVLYKIFFNLAFSSMTGKMIFNSLDVSPILSMVFTLLQFLFLPNDNSDWR